MKKSICYKCGIKITGDGIIDAEFKSSFIEQNLKTEICYKCFKAITEFMGVFGSDSSPGVISLNCNLSFNKEEALKFSKANYRKF